MKKHILLLASFLIISSFLYSQVTTDIVKQDNNNQFFKNGFGMNAGFTTGLGFSYRYMPEKNGLQITGIPK